LVFPGNTGMGRDWLSW